MASQRRDKSTSMRLREMVFETTGVNTSTAANFLELSPAPAARR
jgi:hypothetical protein